MALFFLRVSVCLWAPIPPLAFRRLIRQILLRYPMAPIHFNVAWDLGTRPVLKISFSPSGLKGMCVLSQCNWKRWISPSVSQTQQEEELDGEMCSVPYCYVWVRQCLMHGYWGRRVLPPILKGRKTERGNICNFITTLMGFSIIQELHFLNA